MFNNVKNLIWANQEHTAVDCMVMHEKYGEIPFTASKNDTEEHCHALFAEIIAGVHGSIADYVPPPLIPIATATPSSGTIPESMS